MNDRDPPRPLKLLCKVVENRHALIVLTPEVDDIVALSVTGLNEHHALFVGQPTTLRCLGNDDVVFSKRHQENFLGKLMSLETKKIRATLF